MATITLGMIVKDEGRTLKNCLESVAPYVDEIIIGLAGKSTDDTEQIINDTKHAYPLKDWVVFDIEWTSDFSEARNKVLEKAKGDYFLWLDGDDVLVGGDKLQGYIEKFPNADAFYMGYDYARDEEGNSYCFLVRERLVKLEVGWHWIGKIHEVLVSENAQGNVKVPDIKVIHHKPAGKHEPDRNLKILYKQ